ncbi:MAG: gliding motility protein GldN [Bacteroidales bacterium]|nr:gliding motility protein GldN [Bacteroidales bacterium]
MKKVLIYVLAILGYCTTINAQSIIDADEQRNPNDFYERGNVIGKKAMPYPSLRKSDVVWDRVIWREVDFNEKFNQFFFFPVNNETSTQGRISLINLIMKGVRNGEIPVYEDDDMVKELDLAEAMKLLVGDPYNKRVEALDENGQPIYDEEIDDYVMKDSLVTRSFDSTSVMKIRLKERWYIDKQDTRQKVRIVGLAFQYLKETLTGGQALEWSFWIPMDDMRVRNVFVNANAYDENNDVVERSYDDVFIQRYFDSYIIRESNVYNRSISDYLTGEDAILESQRIEDEIFNVESDMWEY